MPFLGDRRKAAGRVIRLHPAFRSVTMPKRSLESRLWRFALFFSALEFGSIVLGRRLIPTGHPDAMVFVLFLAITVTALNQYAVSHKNHWKQYEREFDGYSKLTKAIGIVVMAVLPVVSGAMAIWLTGAMVGLPR